MIIIVHYSTGDEVFHETANPPWLLEGVSESGANYCWQKQETLKGSGMPAGTLHGGWQFHTWVTRDLVDHHGIVQYVERTVCYSASEAAGMVADGSITNTPVFNRGFTPMFDRSAASNDVYLAMAKYVPAV